MRQAPKFIEQLTSGYQTLAARLGFNRIHKFDESPVQVAPSDRSADRLSTYVNTPDNPPCGAPRRVFCVEQRYTSILPRA